MIADVLKNSNRIPSHYQCNDIQMVLVGHLVSYIIMYLLAKKACASDPS